MSTSAWTPVNENVWKPVNEEAEAAANPPVAPTLPMKQTGAFGEQVEPLHIDPNAPVNTSVLNLNPGGGNFEHAPTTYNEYERESGRDIGTVAGAMGASGLVPSGWGAVGKYLVKPIVHGAGTAIGALTGGATPTEAATTGGQVAAGEGILGGISAGAQALMRTGIFGEGLSNYFVEGANGKYIPTDEAKDIQRIHEAIGVKPGDMNIGLGATTAQDAYNLPGRAIKAAGIKPADLEGLNPFQQAEKLKPIWNKAGEAVAAAADKATQAGVKFDGAKSLTQAIGDMLDPEGTKALKLANDTAKEIGIKNWAKMTPNEAVQLKQALWQRLPGRFKGPVYGALSRDLNTAVPEMIPVNRNYTELRSAMDAIQNSSEKYMSRATPTKFEQMLDLLKQHPAIAGVTGIGGTVSGAMGAYQGGRALYNLVKGE
jgi:hypothetical protein